MERRLEKEFAAYFEARGRFRLDPEGRSAKHTHLSEEGSTLTINQMLVDPADHNDWEVRLVVSLEDSRRANAVVLRFEGVGPVE